jgi:kynurenine--oxoglutarate transaminase/cysteine-S-conjugate beta-lyase/glutamine--phenylpyruvate transaminase
VFIHLKEALARSFAHELSVGLKSDKCYFQSISTELITKRDMMAESIKRAGLIPIIPQSGYFMLVDYTAAKKCLFMAFY